MVDKDLQREREKLLAELTRIDARRIQLKAEIVRENRMSGVSKSKIALKQTERAELLHEREELRQKIAVVNEKLKAQPDGERHPLSAGRSCWPLYLRALRDLPRPLHVQLEYVKDDRPSQLREDAATLRGWLDDSLRA